MIAIKSKKELSIIQSGFKISVFLKGLDGILEIIGGVFLLVVPLEKINSITDLLTRRELIEDPKDFIANLLIHTARSLTVSTIDFTILFLLIHGLIKILLVVMLLRKKLWAYPLAIAVFSLFGIYQLYQIFLNGSLLLIFLTILDVIVVTLTWIEYMILTKEIKTN